MVDTPKAFGLYSVTPCLLEGLSTYLGIKIACILELIQGSTLGFENKACTRPNCGVR